jgi:hypothetical protein
MANSEAERELRAKYLDWCSARLADRFLRLTPDEIYELAQRASAGSEGGGGGREGGTSGVGTELSYRALVELVTETLKAQASLPSFEEWAVAYAEAPERFDDELLGLWEQP